MSTRWYPLYQKGNPQLRVFLPNFWMKLVKPTCENHRKNIVEFHCSMEMTRHDVKSYLEKIYQVPVIKVNTRIKLGEIKKNRIGYVVKQDDIKIAYVQLPRYESFEFPNLFDNEMRLKDKEKEKSELQKAKDTHKQRIEENKKSRPGVPSWYSL